MSQNYDPYHLKSPTIYLLKMVVFLVIVAPMWITMHYRSVNRSSRSLNIQDRESVEHLLATVDQLTDRISTLEAILDADHPQWRQQVERPAANRGEERSGT